VGAEREELIRHLFDRWNRGEREVDPSEIAPDAEIHSALTGFTYRGYGGIQDWQAEIDEQFDSWQLSIEQIDDLPGDRVLVIGDVQFRGRSSGVEFDQKIGWIFRFAGERMVEMRNFPDRASARSAAGALPT
jgi:ketosteroid isomerase-like protein